MSNVESGVQTLYYGLGIIFMLGGAVAAYVKALQLRVGKEEKDLGEYKLYEAERYVPKEYLSETKREVLDSIRDLARRIEQRDRRRSKKWSASMSTSRRPIWLANIKK
jgi:hypothetical protein